MREAPLLSAVIAVGTALATLGLVQQVESASKTASPSQVELHQEIVALLLQDPAALRALGACAPELQQPA